MQVIVEKESEWEVGEEREHFCMFTCADEKNVVDKAVRPFHLRINCDLRKSFPKNQQFTFLRSLPAVTDRRINRFI